MKLTVLADNNTYIDMYYLGEPALSFYIEDGDEKILFDTGYSDVYLKNAEKMGIDLTRIDHIVLSHGHNDHNGGLRFLPAKKSSYHLIGHPGSLEYKEDENGLQIGSFIDAEEIRKKCDITFTKEVMRISEHLYYLGEIEMMNDFEKHYAIGKRIVYGSKEDDYILDDSAIVYKGEKGLFVITGCSHAGICNIIEYAKKVCEEKRISGVIGGFHLFDADERLQRTIEYLKENQIPLLYPCHCVSLKAKIEMGKQLDIREVGVGLRLEIQ